MERKQYLFWVSAAILFGISLMFDKALAAFDFEAHMPLLPAISGWIGKFTIILVALIIMTCFFIWKRKDNDSALTIWSGFIAAMATTFILKLIFARERPDITTLYPFIGLFNYSFPSMHSAAAFSLYPVIRKTYPRFGIIWLVFAAIIAATRIFLSRHYLSDVIFGAALGYSLGYLILYLVKEKRIFKKFPNF